MFERLGEITVLACKMFTPGFRTWHKNVACLSSVFTHGRVNAITCIFYPLKTVADNIICSCLKQNRPCFE